MSFAIRPTDRPDKPVKIDDEEIHRLLTLMEDNPTLKTEPGYINQATQFSKLLSFTEKHMTYLKTHPKVNALNYLSNLRTMIKIRSQ